jgi:hypothetical protein
MKKMIPLLLILFVLKASAQDSTNKSPGILSKKTFGHYRIDGNRISKQEFKTEVYKVPTAIPFYKKAKTNEIIGFSFFAVMAGVAIFGDANRYSYRDTVYRKGRINGYQIGMIISAGGTCYFLLHSIGLYKKAIRARNSALKTIY